MAGKKKKAAGIIWQENIWAGSFPGFSRRSIFLAVKWNPQPLDSDYLRL